MHLRQPQTVLTTQKNRKMSLKKKTELETYQLNIWKIQLLNNLPKFTAAKIDSKKNLLVNNCLVKILIDNGAKVSVCGKQQAKLWGIYDKMKSFLQKYILLILHQSKLPVPHYVL